MLGQEKRSDLDILLAPGRAMDVAPPHHSAIFSGGLFSLLLPSLTFVPHHCTNVTVPPEISSSATLWKKALQGPGSFGAGLLLHILWYVRSQIYNSREQEANLKKKKKGLKNTTT